MPYSKFNMYTINDFSEHEVDIKGEEIIIAFHDITDQNGKYITLATNGKKVWNLYTGEIISDKEIAKKLVKAHSIFSIRYKHNKKGTK